MKTSRIFLSLLLALLLCASLSVSAFAGDAPAFAITKDPYSETVKVGASCLYTSRTNDSNTVISWSFFPVGDDSTTYSAEEIRAKFPDVLIQGENTSCLSLKNIPLELDCFCVRATHTNLAGDSLTSKPALLIVEPLPPCQSESTSPAPCVAKAPSSNPEAVPARALIEPSPCGPYQPQLTCLGRVVDYFPPSDCATVSLAAKIQPDTPDTVVVVPRPAPAPVLTPVCHFCR